LPVSTKSKPARFAGLNQNNNKNMPLQKGSSKKVIGKNIGELVKSKPSSARAKGIRTLAHNRGISEEKAKQIQAQAIAFSKAGKSATPKRKVLYRHA
jgi:hypothetical protein